MICQHCGDKIRKKNGKWVYVPTVAERLRLIKWSGEKIDGLLGICIRSVSGGPEVGEHEPTKEGKVKIILKKLGT